MPQSAITYAPIDRVLPLDEIGPTIVRLTREPVPAHAFSPAAVLAEQAESLERALWAAVRGLEESARLANRMALTPSGLRGRFDEKARTQMIQADIVRRMLLGQGTLSVDDARQSVRSSGNGASQED